MTTVKDMMNTSDFARATGIHKSFLNAALASVHRVNRGHCGFCYDPKAGFEAIVAFCQRMEDGAMASYERRREEDYEPSLWRVKLWRERKRQASKAMKEALGE